MKCEPKPVKLRQEGEELWLWLVVVVAVVVVVVVKTLSKHLTRNFAPSYLLGGCF